MVYLSIDLETFSSIDIKKSGLYKYVQSPDFHILLFAYAFENEAVSVIDLAQGEDIPERVLTAIFDPNTIIRAYNAPFEHACLERHFNTHISIEKFKCTMFHGLYCGYPAGLAAIAIALGLPEDKRKMGIGTSLIKTFCKPCKPTNKNDQRIINLPQHDPEKWELFKEYCKQDVITEIEIENKLSNFPVPNQEQKLWELDQKINMLGIEVDLDLIEGAMYCDKVITEELINEAVQISGLENPKSVKQLSEWLTKETGEEIPNLQKATVKDLIETINNEDAKKMLRMRQNLSKTSIRKYMSMHNVVCEDGRIKGLLQFYGANRTGRDAGRLVQVHNLPRTYLKTLSHARNCVKNKKIESLKIIYGDIHYVLSQLIRTTFVPSSNNVFVVVDFSAIEARIIAWLAKEQWVMDVFATHGKIYEAAAAQMFNVPIEKIVKNNPEYELRQKGKIATLALGYQGSIGALKAMGADKMGLSDEEIQDIVRRWRIANRKIVDLWYRMEDAAIHVVRKKTSINVKGLILAREFDKNNGQDFLTIKLPSGRKLFYAKPYLDINIFGKEAVFYKGINQENKKWESMSTYGGKLVENVTQAIARDCLFESLRKLNEEGYNTVFHVHDEIIIEVAEEKMVLKRICEILEQPIEWASGLLLKADGFISEFYKKN